MLRALDPYLIIDIFITALKMARKDKEMTNEKKPHKHAEVIKAWADGEKIEFREHSFEPWRPATKPSWNEVYEYRIKPKKTYIVRLDINEQTVFTQQVTDFDHIQIFKDIINK